MFFAFFVDSVATAQFRSHFLRFFVGACVLSPSHFFCIFGLATGSKVLVLWFYFSYFPFFFAFLGLLGPPKRLPISYCSPFFLLILTIFLLKKEEQMRKKSKHLGFLKNLKIPSGFLIFRLFPYFFPTFFLLFSYFSSKK